MAFLTPSELPGVSGCEESVPYGANPRELFILRSTFGTSKGQEVLAIKCYSSNRSHRTFPPRPVTFHLESHLFRVPLKPVRIVSTKHPVRTRALLTQTPLLCLANTLNPEARDK